MINRANWQDVQDFLTYQKDVKQLHPQTIRLTWSQLKILLEWAGEKPFAKVCNLKPSFPVYVEGLRTKTGRPLAPAYLTKIFSGAKIFFEWAKREHSSKFRSVSAHWIETLRPSRGRSTQSELHKREIFTVEDVRKLVALPTRNLGERRNRAAVAFLFLSAMRVGAFVTLPIDCVDVDQLMVMQLPEKGVKTKNSKAAITYLLNIPDLLQIVKEWDAEIRDVLPGSAFWYARLTTDGMFSMEPSQAIRREVSSGGRLRYELVEMCRRAGLTYRSPHKLRHGHAVYGLKRAKNMAQMKAVSQNLMHSNMGITDGIYGRLVDDDVRNIITGL